VEIEKFYKSGGYFMIKATYFTQPPFLNNKICDPSGEIIIANHTSLYGNYLLKKKTQRK